MMEFVDLTLLKIGLVSSFESTCVCTTLYDKIFEGENFCGSSTIFI